MRQIGERVYTCEGTGVIETDNSLVVFDPGNSAWCSYQENKNVDGSTFQKIFDFAQQRKKPISKVVISHAHGDHNADMPFYRNAWPKLEAIGHKKYRAKLGTDRKGIDRIIEGDTDLNFQGQNIRILTTPGHTANGEDISLWLPDQRVVFTGDLVQVLGEEYGRGNWDAFVPFYCDGDTYLQSLQRIIDLDPAVVQTMHRGTYQGTKAVRTNIEIIERTRHLAQKLLRENPKVDDQTLAEWIFDTIGYQRGVPKDRVLERRTKKAWKAGTGFQIWDKHGINYFINQARKKQGK